MRDLSGLRDELQPWQGADRRTRDVLDLVELAALEDNQAVLKEAEADAEALSAEVDKLEFKLRLNGPYDRSEAIVTITVGLGGIDQDWTQMLMRMYLRWGERTRLHHGHPRNQAEGEEAGLESVTIEFPQAPSPTAT